MTDIKGILLIPEEGDPRGLLKLGPCDARPPMAFVWDGRYLRLPEDDGRWQACCPSWPKPGDALVLAWDGDAVVEGLDRASRTFYGGRSPWCGNGFNVILVHRAMWESLGTLVLIDAEGREVASG